MAPKPYASGHKLAAAEVNDLLGILDRSTSQVDVVSTTLEADLYSKSVAANAMSTDRALILTVYGDMLNNTGGDEAFVVGVDFGGVTLWRSNLTVKPGALRRAWWMRVEIANLGATNAQVLGGMIGFSDATAPTFGLGRGFPNFNSATSAAVTETMVTVIGGSGTVDTTAAATLAVTCDPTVSNGSLSMRKKYARLELA